VTTEVGQAPARPDDAASRQRGGAHATPKCGMFCRKNPSDAQVLLPAGPVSRPAPAHRPGFAYQPLPATEPATEPATKPDTRRTIPPAAEPDTAPMRVLRGLAPAPADAAGTSTQAGALRSAAAGLCAMILTAAVVPLAVLQIPDAIAWSLPPRLAAQGPVAVASLLRTSSLALPAITVAAPLAALAVRRLRAGPVLLAGLLVLAVADVLGGTAGTILLIGVNRIMHGVGAGIVVVAVSAIVAEPRTEHRIGQRALAGVWAAATVVGLVAAPGVMRHRVMTPSDWHGALQPYPWLTGTALALAALYAVLAEGSVAMAARTAFPAAERSQLALLAAPVAGMCAVTVAVSYRGDNAVIAAAIADVIALAGIAAITARTAAGRFAVVCAVTGFTLLPAAGAVTALTPPTAATGYAAAAVALCGAALALLPRCARPGSGTAEAAGAWQATGVLGRAVTAGGLLLAAAGFAAWYLAGPARYQAGPAGLHGHLLTLVCVPLAGGLGAALTSSLRVTGAAGAMAGVVILLAGVVVGNLAAGSAQLHALVTVRTAQGVDGALAAMAGRWALVAAGVTAAVALMLVATVRGGRRPAAGYGPRATSEPGGQLAEIPSGSPSPRTGGEPDHG
jgi:hypothetical protein